MIFIIEIVQFLTGIRGWGNKLFKSISDPVIVFIFVSNLLLALFFDTDMLVFPVGKTLADVNGWKVTTTSTTSY